VKLYRFLDLFNCSGAHIWAGRRTGGGTCSSLQGNTVVRDYQWRV